MQPPVTNLQVGVRDSVTDVGCWAYCSCCQIAWELIQLQRRYTQLEKTLPRPSSLQALTRCINIPLWTWNLNRFCPLVFHHESYRSRDRTDSLGRSMLLGFDAMLVERLTREAGSETRRNCDMFCPLLPPAFCSCCSVLCSGISRDSSHSFIFF